MEMLQLSQSSSIFNKKLTSANRKNLLTFLRCVTDESEVLTMLKLQSTLWGSSMVDPGLEPHQYLCASMCIEKVWLPCRLPRGQQVLHQRRIWGLNCMQVTKHTSKEIHPSFETQSRVSVTSKNGLLSSKNLKKEKGFFKTNLHIVT